MKKPLGIYIDIDSLIDTRIGVLSQYDTELAIKTIDNINYYTRISEEIDGIDTNTFKEIYNNRNVETLKHSTITNMLFLLKEFILDMLRNTADHPIYDRIVLYVNIHPYQLSKDEINELLDVLYQHTYNSCTIEILNRPLEEIDCLFVYNHIAHMFIYHYNDWLNARSLELKHKGLPYVNLYCPRIFFGPPPTDKDRKEFESLRGDMDLDYFEYFAELFKLVIQINFVPIDHFCIINTHFDDFIDRVQTKSNQNSL